MFSISLMPGAYRFLRFDKSSYPIFGEFFRKVLRAEIYRAFVRRKTIECMRKRSYSSVKTKSLVFRDRFHQKISDLNTNDCERIVRNLPIILYLKNYRAIQSPLKESAFGVHLSFAGTNLVSDQGISSTERLGQFFAGSIDLKAR